MPWLTSEISRNDIQTKAAAESAIIEIRLRGDRAAAIDAIVDLQPSDLNPNLISQLLPDDAEIDAASFEALIFQRVRDIRLATLKIAKRDKLLTTEIARLYHGVSGMPVFEIEYPDND